MDSAAVVRFDFRSYAGMKETEMDGALGISTKGLESSLSAAHIANQRSTTE